MMKYAVHRYVEIGQRQYSPGAEITTLDIESWEMSPEDVRRQLLELAAKGKIEPVSDNAAVAASEYDATEVASEHR